MKIVTPEQMKEIDMQSISNIGVPGIVLMENAAIKVAEEVERTLGSVENKNIIFFAGKGNNGGDAFAAVRHLVNKGAKPKVFIVTEKKLINGDAKLNLNIIEKMGIGVTELLHESQLHAVLSELEASDLVVDGILGTGINGNIKGLIKQVIEIINNAAKRIISIDIPSGINGETGKVLGICIKADTTVTFGLPKIGLIVHPGCEFTGRLIVADISLPTAVIDGLDIKTNLTDESYVSKLIPVRRSESNKGDYGKVFIICGSVGMTGAGTLSGGAALRVGAGLVSLGVPSSLTSIYDITSGGRNNTSRG